MSLNLIDKIKDSLFWDLMKESKEVIREFVHDKINNAIILIRAREFGESYYEDRITSVPWIVYKKGKESFIFRGRQDIKCDLPNPSYCEEKCGYCPYR